MADRIRGGHFITCWKICDNEKIGAIFDLTYSSVSHSVKAVRSKMAKAPKFREYREYMENLNSQFKV